MKKFFANYKIEIIVFLIFVLSRLPGLGSDTFNTDVWKWKARSYDFGSGVFGLDFEKTIQKYHPGVTLMWLGALGIKIYNLTSPKDSLNTVFGLNTVQKVLVVLAIGATLSFIFYVLKKLFGNKYAFISVFLLLLEPFYVALTREFHLEGLISTFMLASILWFYYWLEDNSKSRRFLASSFFAALAFLTKTSSLFLIPFFGLSILVFSKKSLKEIIVPFAKWLVLVAIFCFVMWPALWVNAPEVFKVLYKGIFTVGIEGDHEQYFFGKLVSDPGVLYYPVVFFFRSSVYLMLGLVGAVVFRKKFVDKKTSRFILFLALYAFFYALELTISSKKLDRYLIPSVTSLVLIASFFYVWLISGFSKLKAVLFFAFPILTLVCIHPDYFSYYNPVFGGLKTGIFVIEPKWMVGEKEIVKFFKQVEKDGNYKFSPEDESFEELIKTRGVENVLSVGFPEKYYTQIWPFLRRIGAWGVIKDLTPFAIHAKYFVYPVWVDGSYSEDRFKLEFVDVIKVRGTPVYNVYKKV